MNELFILLQIHDGPNIKSPLIGRYCGSARFDQPIITNGNEVTILFMTDFASTAEGFTIKYETCTYKYICFAIL